MCKERHWEFFSHGIYNTRYTYGLDEAQERAMIRDSMETIYQYTGQACSAIWHLHYLILRSLWTYLLKSDELFGEKRDLYLRPFS